MNAPFEWRPIRTIPTGGPYIAIDKHGNPHRIWVDREWSLDKRLYTLWCRAPLAPVPEPITIDLDRNTINVMDHEPTKLTAVEAEMMSVLAQRLGTVVTTECMIARVWGVDEPQNAEGSIKVIIAHIRKKIAHLPCEIITHWGVGLELVVR
jgi:hypothetical protein